MVVAFGKGFLGLFQEAFVLWVLIRHLPAFLHLSGLVL
jgi:hypothetical protein